MCSPRSAIQAALFALLLAASAASRAVDVDTGPTSQEVKAAATHVAQDPDLGKRVKQRTLRLKDTEPAKRDKPGDNPFEWLVNLMRWLTESARMLVWLVGAIAVAVLLVGLRHWIRARADAKVPLRVQLPSYVQSLDIRPESLPEDIGAAAASLWTNGEQRAALSLLYRGALSRLVHDHEVPIRAASTEGECMQLATQRLDAPRGVFFAQLVRAWQLAVYGARLPDTQQALALCREFDAQLGSGRATRAAA